MAISFNVETYSCVISCDAENCNYRLKLIKENIEGSFTEVAIENGWFVKSMDVMHTGPGEDVVIIKCECTNHHPVVMVV